MAKTEQIFWPCGQAETKSSDRCPVERDSASIFREVPLARNLILCMDGTGNTDHLGDDGNDTNVVKLFEGILERTDAGEPQLKQYYQGVGTEFGTLFQGQAFGTGIDQLILNGYKWLCHRYKDGDRVFLFGFSRGAYAVRSLTGLISRCGLLDCSSDDPVASSDDENLLKAYAAYRARSTDQFRNQNQTRNARIRCLGVFDTVGALGIPLSVQGILSNLVPKVVRDNLAAYEFHDTDLSAIVDNGFHALALDERRPDFRPVLWNPTDKPDQRVEQVWFSGCHSDIGGGYTNRGLASISFRWMASKAQECGLALGTIPAYECHGLEEVHDSYSGYLGGLYPRAVESQIREFGPKPSAALHASVELRMAKNPAYVPMARGATRTGPIRPTVVPTPTRKGPHEYRQEVAALCVSASQHVYNLKAPLPAGLTLRSHSRSADGTQSLGIYATEFGSILAFEGTFTHFGARKGVDPALSLQERLLSVKDWAENFRACLTEDPEGVLPGKVHRGFLEQFRAVWPDLRAWMLNFEGLGEVFITGHSQGGALAVLAGASLWAHGLDASAIYTFAAPRAGTRSLVDSFQTPAFRFEFHHDIVPHVPFHRPSGSIFGALLEAVPAELRGLIDDVNYCAKGELVYSETSDHPARFSAADEDAALVSRFTQAFGHPKSWAPDHSLENYRSMVANFLAHAMAK